MKVQKPPAAVQVVSVVQLPVPEFELKTFRRWPLRVLATGIMTVTSLLKVSGMLGMPYWIAAASVLPEGKLVTVLVAFDVVS